MSRGFRKNIIQLWPVVTKEFIDGSNGSSFTSMTIRNLYTNESINVSSNDVFTTYSQSSPNLPQIHNDTYLSNK